MDSDLRCAGQRTVGACTVLCVSYLIFSLLIRLGPKQVILRGKASREQARELDDLGIRGF